MKKVGKILLILLVLVVIVFIATLLFVADDPKPVKDVEHNMSLTVTNDGDYEREKNNITQFRYYDSKEEALGDFSAINNNIHQYNANELTYIGEYKTNSFDRLFYMIPDKQPGGYGICCYDIYIENEKFSQLVNYYTKVCDGVFPGAYYDCADSVAESIYYELHPIIDGNKFVYCGFWDNKKEIESLTVCGQKVDIIKSLKFSDGKSTYMWIIKLDDIKPKMQTIEGKLTYGKMEEALDIKYIPVKKKK